MKKLSQEAFEVLVKIVDLVEDNNDINGGKWSDWQGSLDIVSHFFKVQSNKYAYVELSEDDRDAIGEHLEEAIKTNSSPIFKEGL